MYELKRKDKILIVVFALATLVMSVANPNDYDIRSLAWDVGLLIVAGCSFFWFIGELGSVVASGMDVDSGTLIIPKSRKELVNMVGDATGIGEKILNEMSDVELMGLLNGRSKSSRVVSRSASGGATPIGTVLMAVIRLLARTVSYVIKSLIHMPRTIRSLNKTLKKGMKRLSKIWKEESR